ncbi:MAG: YaeQ family protein [Planctomycetes bacterium]|nr:YaeQ family protein [Planctomycetota bacterium]
MSQGSLLHRFQIGFEDAAAKRRDELDLRVARASSEVGEYLVARVLAWCLLHETGIELSAGLCKGDEPSVAIKGYDGVIQTWIEIGIPESKKLHRASKAAKRVLVFPHRGPKGMPVDEPVHKGEAIEVVDLGAEFLHGLAGTLDRNNKWKIKLEGEELTVHDGQRARTTRIERSKPFRPRR